MLTNVKYFISKNKTICSFILLLLLGFGWYLWIHRRPYTQNAFVVANVRPVSALVPGYITDIYVNNNQPAKKGAKLFTVFEAPYKLAVDTLQNSLKSAGFQLSMLKEQSKRDAAQIKERDFQFKNAQYKAMQAAELYKTKAVSQKEAENYLRLEQAAAASLQMARAELAMTLESINGAKANIKKIQAELEISKINLSQTTVYARANGIVCNMFTAVGTYVKPGQSLFAFVETDKWWVQANFKETELPNLREGQKADIKLWMYPGKIFNGVVDKIGWGVNRQLTSSDNAMSEVIKENEWFLLPQRFPVQILIVDPDPEYPLHMGSSAYVSVDVDSEEFRQIIWQIGF